MAAPLVSIEQQIAEVRRQIDRHKRVYPPLVSARKMRRAEADYTLSCLDGALGTLIWVKEHRAEILAAIPTMRGELS